MDYGLWITNCGLRLWIWITNNGYTEFENGMKVESVENRWVSFPEDIKHRGTSCTDEKVRVVINFNYLT